MTIGLTADLTATQWVVIDPRPWHRTVIRYPDKAGVAGWLSGPTPRMQDMTIAPGSRKVTLRGTDLTGTAYARVRWREARTRP